MATGTACPDDADLVFDVRFLPNPHFVPEFRPLTGRHPRVAKYIRSFPQTKEFISRISELLVYLLPHYIREGKSYLTISFGCTGGQHRSVMIAEDVSKKLRKAGYKVKVVHRDSPEVGARLPATRLFGNSACGLIPKAEPRASSPCRIERRPCQATSPPARTGRDLQESSCAN